MLMVASALLVHHLGNCLFGRQKSCILSDWQPLLVVVFAHGAVLALAERSPMPRES